VLGIKGHDGKRMDVLMINATAFGLGGMHQHLPRLTVRKADVVKGVETADEVTGGGDAIWYLDGYHVAVSGNSESTITRGANADKIPNLSKMATKGLAPRFLAENPGPFIAARIRFAGGTLTSEFPDASHGHDYSTVKFKFDPKPETGADYEQELADAALGQTLTSGALTLEFSQLNTNPMNLPKKPKTLVLQTSDATPLAVKLTNNTMGVPCDDNAQVQRLEHFAVYYELLSDKVKYVSIPTNGTLKCGSENEIIRCPPVEA